MRLLLSTLLLTLLISGPLALIGQSTAPGDSLAPVDSVFLRLVATDWLEITPQGDTTGFILRLTDDGSFEEDAGENFTRPSRYLLGRWRIEDGKRLTLGVDGLLASNLPRQYRKGKDYYVPYELSFYEDGALRLIDLLTHAIRRFEPQPRAADYLDAAERRKPKPILKPDEPILKLPPGWGGH